MCKAPPRRPRRPVRHPGHPLGGRVPAALAVEVHGGFRPGGVHHGHPGGVPGVTRVGAAQRRGRRPGGRQSLCVRSPAFRLQGNNLNTGDSLFVEVGSFLELTESHTPVCFLNRAFCIVDNQGKFPMLPGIWRLKSQERGPGGKGRISN